MFPIQSSQVIAEQRSMLEDTKKGAALLAEADEDYGGGLSLTG